LLIKPLNTTPLHVETHTTTGTTNPAPPHRHDHTGTTTAGTTTAGTTTNNSDQKPVHRTAAPPAPVVLKPRGDYIPQESETWKLIAETDSSSISKEKLELLAKPVIDPEMDPHDPIFSDVYTPPKISNEERLAAAKQHKKDNSPKPGTPVRTLSPRQSPKPGEGGAVSPGNGNSNGSLSAVQAAALASEPNSRGASRGRSPNPKGEMPAYETNSIGGRKRIAQSSTFNRVMANLMHAQGGE